MRERRESGAGRDGVLGLVRDVRRRWRLRVLLRGLVFTLAAALVAFLVSARLLEALRFSPGAVTGLRVAAWGLVAVVAAVFLVRPLLRRVSDRQVALYLEEHEPSLEASVLGALEAEEARRGGDAGGAGAAGRGGLAASPALVERLVERAVERARDVEYGRRVDQRGLFRYSGALAGLSLAAVALAVLSPTGVRHGLGALLRPTTDAASVSPYSIEVEPGDVTVARGSDLFVRARLVGFGSEEVFLYTTSGEDGGDATPRRLSMIPTGALGAAGSETPGSHELLLVSLQGATEYFVEADGVRSPTYRLDVADLPYVDRMDHTYRFPAYTGLSERVVEDGGDVVAVAGTRVDVVVHPTIPSPAGRLVVEGGEPVELAPGPDGTLVGTLDVDGAGFYRVELARSGPSAGQMVEASPRYTIDVLRDLSPGISVTEPGRDVPVSPIEEVYVEARADDDFAVADVRLVRSVNGGAPDTVSLWSDGGGAPLREVTAGHTLFLEEWPLEPGDLISYWVEARDARAGAPGPWITSDIYFLEVRPFRRDFREQEQQGGGMPQGGGQAGAETALSELQRQVVVATFNLVRDRETWSEREFTENVTSVALAQGRVREQVGTLLERMRNRGLAAAEDRFREIAEMLPGALEDMASAEEMLRGGEPGDALTPEQRALRVLQKAEETYERYVGNEQQAGGGGGGQGGANAEDLADLFELELDKLRNQYETVQRGERQQQDATVDELMEKLDELSRRQEQEAERQRRRAGSNQSAGGGGGQGQRSLADETEEAARQLERLARDTGDRQLQETARRLQEAADAMRRSAAESGNASGAAEAEAALDRLRDAERRLTDSRDDRTEDRAREALDRADRLAESQEQVREALERLSDDPGERREQLDRIDERKQAMQREAAGLKGQLDRMADDVQRDDPGTARAATEAADLIENSKLEAKIAWSRGVVRERDEEFARGLEEQIAGDIDEVRRKLEEATRSAASRAEDRSAEDRLDRARDLVRGVESLSRRLDDRARGEAKGEQGGRGAEEGEGAEGERGEQQGQGDPSGEGQGGDRAGRAGSEGGSPGGAEGGPGGGATRGDPRPFTPEEIRQYQRSFREQLEAARQLRRELSEGGQDVEELDGALDALERLAQAETYGDLPQIELLREEVRRGLMRVEFTLRREVEGAAGQPALTGSDDVPAAFRELVEEYYRSLARGGRGGGGGGGGS